MFSWARCLWDVSAITFCLFRLTDWFMFTVVIIHDCKPFKYIWLNYSYKNLIRNKYNSDFDRAFFTERVEWCHRLDWIQLCHRAGLLERNGCLILYKIQMKVLHDDWSNKLRVTRTVGKKCSLYAKSKVWTHQNMYNSKPYRPINVEVFVFSQHRSLRSWLQWSVKYHQEEDKYLCAIHGSHIQLQKGKWTGWCVGNSRRLYLRGY